MRDRSAEKRETIGRRRRKKGSTSPTTRVSRRRPRPPHFPRREQKQKKGREKCLLELRHERGRRTTKTAPTTEKTLTAARTRPEEKKNFQLQTTAHRATKKKESSAPEPRSQRRCRNQCRRQARQPKKNEAGQRWQQFHPFQGRGEGGGMITSTR